MATVTPARRRARLAAIVLATVLLGLGGTYLVLGRLFPPARLAALLADEVKTATGRDFRIGGDLSFRLLPTIAVVASDLSLGNAAWGSRPEMARIKRAAFEIALKPLLEGRISILRVEVDGADLLLESDGHGQVNWIFTPPAKPPPAVPAEPGAAPASGTQVQIDRLVASDVRLSYRDGVTGIARSAVIEALDLHSRGGQDVLSARLNLGGPRWKIDGQIGSVLGLAGENGDWPFELHASAAGVDLSASGQVGTGPRASQVRTALKASITATAPLLPLAAAAASLPVPLSLEANFQRTGDLLQADGLRLSVAGQQIGGQLTVHTDGAQPRLGATLSAPSLDLARLLAALPPAQAGQPAGAAAAGAAKGGPLFGDQPLPTAALASLPDLQLALHVDSLLPPGAPALTALDLALRTAPGRLDIERLAFAGFGGQVDARGGLTQVGAAPPKWTLQLGAKGLSVEALLALAGPGRPLRGGRASLSGQLALSGHTPRSLAASASGELLLQASGLTLSGNTALLDRNPLVTLLDALLPQRSASGEMAISCAVVRLPLQHGLARIDRSVALETPQLAVSASGELDLRAQTLALAFRPSVKKGLGLSPASLAQLVMLQGPIQAPQIVIDAKGTAREAVVLGAAVATGGLSLLAGRLVDHPAGSLGCQAALAGGKDSGKSGAAAPARTAKPGTGSWPKLHR